MTVQPLPILIIEGLLLVVTVAGVWDAITSRARSHVPPELVQRGIDVSLTPWYRRKVTRTIGGKVQRWKLKVEVAAKRMAAKR